METLVIGFSRPKGGFEPFSWLIRAVDGSQFSHAYIRYYNPFADRWVIFQASGLVVNAISANNFDAKEFVYAEFSFEIDMPTKIKTVQFAIDQLGIKYGVKWIIGIGIVKLANLFRMRIKNPFASGDATMVCSKLVAMYLDTILLPTDSIDFETATPTDVYNFLIAKGFSPSGTNL